MDSAGFTHLMVGVLLWTMEAAAFFGGIYLGWDVGFQDSVFRRNILGIAQFIYKVIGMIAAITLGFTIFTLRQYGGGLPTVAGIFGVYAFWAIVLIPIVVALNLIRWIIPLVKGAIRQTDSSPPA